MKKKVVMVTSEDLLDVDLPIVKEIHNQYDLLWIVIFRGYNWFSQQDIIDFCNVNDIKHKLFSQELKIKNPKTIFFNLKLLKYINSLEVDLIYDSYLGTPYFHFFVPFFLKRNKFIIAIHDVVQHYNMNYRGIRAFYVNFIISKYNNIHLFSSNQKKEFLSLYPNYSKNILLAPLCLKNFGFSSQPDFQIKKSNKINFLFFGILRENKGIDILVKAVNILAKIYTNFSITIAGKAVDEYWVKCAAQIDDKSYYELIIRPIEKNEIPGLFQAAHFSVLPYFDVTQSGVLLTSYNYNVPAIASNLDGFTEYIENGATGLLFDMADSNALANTMANAIAMNSTAYNNMKERLQCFVETKISASAISKKYISYFNEIMEIS